MLHELKALADPRVREKMAYFGVDVPKAHGISTPVLHRLARRIGKNHQLARELWLTGIHEARILATLIGEPQKLNVSEMERWTRDFDSWDLVDAACCYLYAYSRLAWDVALAWSYRREEYVKRAAFSLMAYLSYKDKEAANARFRKCLRIIEREASDERHFVKKAVNWALRNIGKRNLQLNREAIRAAERIRRLGASSARWIASDALRELRSPAVQARLRRKMGENK
ncbi:MAG TPA: DNA alkylation repair protein [Candidatus Angelobacter sp.]|nr:DNA alkylation repair protein [Candidatus Angelobacter sp.]